MWGKSSNLSQHLTELKSKKVKFKWISVEQNTSNEIKQVVNREDLLIFLDFNQRFDIHRDFRKLQQGEVITQNGKPIYLYIGRLTQLQQWYTVTEEGMA